NTVAIESATSASGGSTTADTAAIAEAPQIAVPQPTRVCSDAPSRSARPASGASTSATANVESVTGSVPSPVPITVPGRQPAGSGRTLRSSAPSTIAQTGAPTSGSARAQSHATAAISADVTTPAIAPRRFTAGGEPG